MKSTLIIVVIVLFFIGCNNSNKESYLKSSTLIAKDSIHPGKHLMEINCYACHDATTEEEHRIAPPMIAIKRRYILKNTSKEEFVKDMKEWINNPNEKEAKMFGAVRRFGVMQKLPYPEETIAKIAEYIYDYEIEEPAWFTDHYNNMRGYKKI